MRVNTTSIKLCLMLVALLVLLCVVLYCAGQGWKYAVVALISAIYGILRAFANAR